MTKTELEKEISKLKREDRTQKENFTKLTTENKETWKRLKELAFIISAILKANTRNKKAEADFKKQLKEISSKGEILHPIHKAT